MESPSAIPITNTKIDTQMENRLTIDFDRGKVSLMVVDCPIEFADSLMEVNKEMANYMETLRQELLERRTKAKLETLK